MDEEKLERSKRLQYLHGALINLLMNEGHLITERTNNFILLNSILFAAYILIIVDDDYIPICSNLKLVLPILGIFTCYFHISTTSLAFEVATFWRTSIGLIEKDEDFWYPPCPAKDKDLDIIIAKTKYMDAKYHKSNEQTRQSDPYCILGLSHSKPGEVIRELPFKLSSTTFFEYWTPFIIFSLWGIAFYAYAYICFMEDSLLYIYLYAYLSILMRDHLIYLLNIISF
jgi:hypothetical protein